MAQPQLARLDAVSDEFDAIHSLGLAGGNRDPGRVAGLESETAGQRDSTGAVGGVLRSRAQDRGGGRREGLRARTEDVGPDPVRRFGHAVEQSPGGPTRRRVHSGRHQLHRLGQFQSLAGRGASTGSHVGRRRGGQGQSQEYPFHSGPSPRRSSGEPGKPGLGGHRDGGSGGPDP